MKPLCLLVLLTLFLSVVDIREGKIKIIAGESKEASFEIVPDAFTWEEARVHAQIRGGGRLAVLDNQEYINRANALIRMLKVEQTSRAARTIYLFFDQ